MAETYSAGIVTAYGAAVRGGYTGTYEQFCAEQAQFGVNAAKVAQDRAAVEAATETFTTETVPGAVQTVQQTGATQVQAVEAASETEQQQIALAGAAQETRVTQAGDDQVDAVEEAGATQVQAVEDKGQEVIGSIPADYTELTEDVADLKSALYGGTITPSWRLGTIWLDSDFSMHSTTKRICTVESFKLNKGATVGLSDYTGTRFMIGCKVNGVIKQRGTWRTEDFVATITGDYEMVVANNPEVVLSSVEDLSSLVEIINAPIDGTSANILASTTFEQGSFDNYGYPTSSDIVVRTSDFIGVDGIANIDVKLDSNYVLSTLLYNDRQRYIRRASGTGIIDVSDAAYIKVTIRKSSSTNFSPEDANGLLALNVDLTEFYKNVKSRNIVAERNADVLDAIYSLRKRFNDDESIPKDFANHGETDLFTIAHISDMHADSLRYYNFAKFCDEMNEWINLRICTGDRINNSEFNLMNQVDSLFNNSIHQVCGNHERYNSRTLADTYEPWGYTTNTGKLYYYEDFDDKKIRLIVLNQYDVDGTGSTTTEHFSQTQINWFIDTLKDATTKDYSVIVAMHAPEGSLPTINNKGFRQRWHQWPLDFVVDGTPIEDIINAFKNGESINKTYTFSDTKTSITANDSFENAGTFIAYMCGHMHGDLIGYSANHSDQLYLCITCGCCTAQAGVTNDTYWNIPSDLPRFQGTRTEDAFNIYSIDQTHRIVKVLRIGSNLNDFLEPRKYATYDY